MVHDMPLLDLPSKGLLHHEYVPSDLPSSLSKVDVALRVRLTRRYPALRCLGRLVRKTPIEAGPVFKGGFDEIGAQDVADLLGRGEDAT